MGHDPYAFVGEVTFVAAAAVSAIKFPLPCYREKIREVYDTWFSNSRPLSFQRMIQQPTEPTLEELENYTPPSVIRLVWNMSRQWWHPNQ
jgi:hypothetical protein